MLLKGPLCIRKYCSKLHLRMVYSKEKPNFKYLRVSKLKLPELWSKVQWFCTNSVLTSFGIKCPDGARRFCLLLTLCCICLRLFGSRQVIFFCWLVLPLSWLRYLYRCTLVQVSHWQYCGLLLAWNIQIINKQDCTIYLNSKLPRNNQLRIYGPGLALAEGTDYGHTKAKPLIHCGPNSNSIPNKYLGCGHKSSFFIDIMVE